jgi:gluconate kinase
MPPALLDSQLAALEPPVDAIDVDVDAAVADQVATARNALNLGSLPHGR